MKINVNGLELQNLLKERGDGSVCKILIVGTGGLALWALRIAAYHFTNMKDRVTITIASLKDDGLEMAQEFQKYVFYCRL